MSRQRRPRRADLSQHFLRSRSLAASLIAQAPVTRSDLVVEVAGEPIDGLAELFRKVWGIGPAGSDIPLTIVRDGESHPVVLESIDRDARLKYGAVH